MKLMLLAILTNGFICDTIGNGEEIGPLPEVGSEVLDCYLANYITSMPGFRNIK